MTNSLMDQLLERVTLGPRERTVSSVDTLEEAHGTRLTGAVRAYFERQDRCELEGMPLFHCYGHAIPQLEPSEANRFVAAMDGELPLIGAFTGSAFLAHEGGGEVYYVSLAPDAPEVAIYGPGEGAMRYLADSLEAVAGLVLAVDRWESHAEAEGLDTEDLIEGRVTPPGDGPLAELLAALEGHVHLPHEELDDDDGEGAADLAVLTVLEEIVPRLAGKSLAAPRDSALVAAFERAYPIVSMLDHRGLFPLEPGQAPAGWADTAAGALHWLWHGYLTSDSDSAERALALADHGAALVRDAARIVADLERDPASWPALGHVPVLRELMADPPTAATEPPAGHEALLDGSDAAKKLERSPADADHWNALTYEHFGQSDWPSMLGCADIAAALRPHHYYPWLQRGIALMMLERYPEAVAAFDRGLCYERHDDLLLNKAMAFRESGDRDGAVATLRRIPRWKRAETIARVPELADLADSVDPPLDP